jgi:AraC-like DNA-binding protein
MPFIEFEKSVRKNDWSMHDLHTHPHYEIYFLTKGSREFFLADALYKVTAPVLVVIPPYVMHKTEGGPFERYNVNVSADFLDPFQKETLDKCALRFLQPSETETALFCNLFDEGAQIQPHEKHAEYRFRALLGFTILTLHRIHGTPLPPTATAKNQMPPLMLKVIDYFNTHYAEKQNLDKLAQRFFVSKATLIYNFNKYASCSPIDFLLNVRLTKAKDLLTNSDKSVGEISDACGFSSANYFGLIFKKKDGISPLQYRKNQRSKV